MSKLHSPTIMVLLLFVVFSITTESIFAEDEPAEENFPTLAALEQTIIPISDPVDLARRLWGVDAVVSSPTVEPVRSVGDQQRFRASNSDGGYSFDVNATLRVIGDSIYIWVQNGTNISTSDLESLARSWDANIYQQARQLWGSEDLPGIDGDTRAHALFAYDLGYGVAGYFGRKHIFPEEVFPDSNEAEMFFMSLDALEYEIASPYVQGVMAHEFQHMIRNNIDSNEDAWLGEGFSTFTELYLGFDSSLWFADTYLSNPDTQLNTWADYAPDRPRDYGASLLFVTYFYERYGLEAIQQLSADPANGLISFDNALRALEQPGVDILFADWVLANWIQDTSIDDGRYGYTMLTLPQTPAIRATVDHYPYTAEATVPQYGAHYYVLSRLNGIKKLNIALEMPSVVPLIPTSAPSGEWMWYSHRGDVSNMALTRAFDLTEVGSATLNYRAWYQIEEDWDYAYLEVSMDGGKHWELLVTPNMADSNPFGNAYGTGYTGDSNGWIEQSISLDAFTGQDILVRFEMVTDDTVNLPGLALDDVNIPEIGYVADFEADDGGWQAEGWMRIDNRLPQQAWVQAIQYAGDEATVTRWQIPDAGDGESWMLPLAEGVDQVVLVVSPFATVTTVPATYTLTVTNPND